MKRQRYGPKADAAGELPARKSASRDTQLKLQGRFADGIAKAAINEPAPGDEYQPIRDVMAAHAETPEWKRDLAWLRYYSR